MEQGARSTEREDRVTERPWRYALLPALSSLLPAPSSLLFLAWTALSLLGPATGNRARAQTLDAVPRTTSSAEMGTVITEQGTTPPMPGTELAAPSPTAFERLLARPDLLRADVDFRFGAWGRFLDGNPTLVAKYQGVDSSPFANVDGLYSDGVRTVDLFATEMDNETDAAKLDYYGPNLTAHTRFDRFIHRGENDPLSNFDPTQSAFRGVNYNAGDDFATRIEDWKADFHGMLVDDVQWRVKFNTIHKHGERQVTGLHRHISCDGPQCHVAGTRQTIDWTTVNLQPSVEGKFGPIKIEVSDQYQSLSPNDQLITNIDGGAPFFSSPTPYGYIPENATNTGRLRMNVDLMEDTKFNANLFMGDTHNFDRDIHRRFKGFDLQVTTQALDDHLSLTAFGKRVTDESDTTQQFVIPEEVALIQPLINYGRTSTGALARWRMFRRSDSTPWDDSAPWFAALLKGLSISGGYEYREIDRVNADYVGGFTTFDESLTTANIFFVDTKVEWSRKFDSYVRYKMESTQGPIYGVTFQNGTVNSNLPEHINTIELGGDLVPEDNFSVNFSVEIQPSSQKTLVANFNETELPMALTVSYAPLPRWSLAGGYCWNPVWIRQNIILGDDAPLEALPFKYSGVSQRVHFASRYAWTDSLSLSTRLQYIRGENTTTAPPPWQELPLYSNLSVQNTELSVGADWWVRERVLLYAHYNYSDYQTQPTQTYAGTIHMILFGINAFY